MVIFTPGICIFFLEEHISSELLGYMGLFLRVHITGAPQVWELSVTESKQARQTSLLKGLYRIDERSTHHGQSIETALHVEAISVHSISVGLDQIGFSFYRSQLV